MSVPATYTRTFTAGDSVKLAFLLQEKDLDFPEVEPAPRDLTGWTARAQVRKTPTSEELLAEWELEAPLDATGIVRLRLTGEQTQSWAVHKTLVSDVELTDPNGDVTTILRIDLTVLQDITRDQPVV